MQVVILCGGRGIRLWPETKSLPKPIIRIGEKPILWHVMNAYDRFGFRDFVLCLGYKGDAIRRYFAKGVRGWNIEFAQTGERTPTGERIKKIEHLIDGDQFFATYADGLANLDLRQLKEHHETGGRLATITVVKPLSPFGIVNTGEDGQVVRFEEKPRMNQWINGGFFVLSTGVFDHIDRGDILERDVFRKLVRIDQLRAFKHRGFWRCMDTYKDAIELNELANHEEPPWNFHDGEAYRDNGG